jgi:glutamine synthetase
MTEYGEIAELIERHDLGFVDLRVTDLVGRFRHVTVPAARFTAVVASHGVGVDGSNYGFRPESGSDMVVVPDLSTAHFQEFDGERVLCVIGNLCLADSREPAPVDPRGIAMRAEAHLRQLGIADDVLVSPEFEFYVFDRASFESDAGHSCARVVPFEGSDHSSNGRTVLGSASAYHAAPPQDRLFALRNEMVRRIEAAGIAVKYHHHEVGPYGQLEIELGFAPLLNMADATLIVKSIVRTVAHEADLTATFMPKPLYAEAGNGLHLHQYLVKDGSNLFGGQDGLTELALCYVGGLLRHGPSLMGLTNPSTNSYCRLVPGYEAPVQFAFGSGDRTAAVRVPAYAHGPEARIELRTMDATCNPYLAFAAVLLAGIDGIQKRMNAAELGYGHDSPVDDAASRERVPPSDLQQSLAALAGDHDYLTRSGAFTEQDLQRWIAVKESEAAAVAARPHPHEFTLYYDL